MRENKGNDELARIEWEELMMLKGEVIVALRAEMNEPLIIAYMSSDDYERSLDMSF